jgi:hypothetical protein
MMIGVNIRLTVCIRVSKDAMIYHTIGTNDIPIIHNWLIKWSNESIKIEALNMHINYDDEIRRQEFLLEVPQRSIAQIRQFTFAR